MKNSLSKQGGFRGRLPFLTILIILTLTTLACGIFTADSPSSVRRFVMLNHLPTLTATMRPALPVTITVTPVAGNDREPTSLPTSVIAPTAVLTTTPAAVAAIETVSSPIPDTPTSPAVISDSSSIQTPTAIPVETTTDIPIFTPTSIPTFTPLPTDVPTPSPTSTPTPPPTNTPTPLPTDTPTPPPTDMPTPTATPKPLSQSPGWSFAGVRLQPNQDENSLVLYGDLINNTGSPQILERVTGIFYDAQEQVIADAENTYDHWPFIDTIPANGRLPFELTVEGIQKAANFGLAVEAYPDQEAPNQDFEFLDVSQTNEGNNYCLAGKLQNRGHEWQDYLVIAAILYDDQDNVINFKEFYAYHGEEIEDDQNPSFEICVTSLDSEMVRYELQAWGR